MDLNEKIESIESKVRQLATELNRLRRENAALLSENEKLKATFSKSDEMVVDLKRQLEKTQQALDKKQEDDPEHAVKLRKQIDKYIEEVSKCIEWLEKA
jgi:chromosome segregation ATPase